MTSSGMEAGTWAVRWKISVVWGRQLAEHPEVAVWHPSCRLAAVYSGGVSFIEAGFSFRLRRVLVRLPAGWPGTLEEPHHWISRERDGTATVASLPKTAPRTRRNGTPLPTRDPTLTRTHEQMPPNSTIVTTSTCRLPHKGGAQYRQRPTYPQYTKPQPDILLHKSPAIIKRPVSSIGRA